eukprot:m.222873 g.222873  ORF g.222873 m.222873 type:complete len:310 (+) comp16126_c0_seq1:28-957(+)
MAEHVVASQAVKEGFFEMLKGGVIMDVMNTDQARVAEEAGAVAVMALERVPADIRAQGGVARMSAPELITGIKKSVTIPVLAKARIGHTVEAEILEALGVDGVDESEVLTVADWEAHIDKRPFKVPFVCGCRDLGEALRRIDEGAAMIRTKGEAGTGDVCEAVRHAKQLFREIAALKTLSAEQLEEKAREYRVPVALVTKIKDLGRLPVVTFAAGGLATPADVALLFKLGVDGVFVGSGIFKSGDPTTRARAMVLAARYWNNPLKLAEISANIGEAMVGRIVDDSLTVRMAGREGGPGQQRGTGFRTEK